MAYGSLVALALILSGCAHVPAPTVAPPAPVYDIAPDTLQLIDDQIITASVHARHGAEAYAQVAMEEWQGLVRRQTEEVFIPWYSSYWTQQWIATRLAWYQLQHTEGEPTPEGQLVSYLQDEFSAQVLLPASGFIDPRNVMQEAARDYLRELGGGLEQLSSDLRIPLGALNQRLDAIPAVVVQVAGTQQKASLYSVLQADELSALPAYQALLEQIAADHGTVDQTPSADRMALVARRAVSRLVGTMALRGGATAASTLIGGLWGAVISAGTAAWGAAEHDRDRQAMETQLRENLEAALEIMWQDLVEDRHAGVSAPVHHMSTQIEQAAYHPLPTPLPPINRDPAVLF